MMRTVLLSSFLLVMLLGDTSQTAPIVEAASANTHRVTGKVVAINTSEQPHTIVLSAKSVSGELIVGATVGEGIAIRRGKKSIALDQLRVGETVQLTYEKTSSGLVAVSILAS